MTKTNGSSSPRSALKNHSMKSSAPPTGPFSKSISGQWTAIFGSPGSAPRAISSMLGWVAAVRATESPSQLSPALIQSTRMTVSSSAVATAHLQSERTDGASARPVIVCPVLFPRNRWVFHLWPGRTGAARQVRAPSLPAVGGDRCLPDADAAVVRWHVAVDEHLETLPLQPGPHELAEPGVLEDASGEGDGAQASAPRQLRRRRHGGPADAFVEPGRDDGRGDAAGEGIEDGGDEGRRVDDELSGGVHLEGEWIRRGAGRHGAGQRLELDGGLALVAHTGSAGHQGGYCVEEPAHARRDGRGGRVHQAHDRGAAAVELS